MLVVFGFYTCGESTVTEPKSDFEEFTEKVWVYKKSNVGHFTNNSIQKMKFNKDSTCKIMLKDNWESGRWQTHNFKLGLFIIYNNDSLNYNDNFRHKVLTMDSVYNEKIIVHFGFTYENSWHTYVPEK